ncbi:MAG: hypothetical protein AAB489_04875 [Patescibacteria group bacterium]
MVSVTINGDEFEIHPPFFDCPRCGKKTFGVLHVGVRGYIRACCECPIFDAPGGEVPPVINLPKLSKKVIYLDQHAISGMAKALRPKLQRRKMEQHVQEAWVKLYHKLDRLRRLQLIVCPFSMHHRRESFMDDRLYKYLKALYKRLANGVEFFEPFKIQSIQVMQYARHHLDNSLSPFIDNPQTVVLGTINSWERYSLSAGMQDFEWKPEGAKLMREQNEAANKNFQTIYDRWKQGGMSIEDRIEEESKGFSTTVRKTYALLFAKNASEHYGLPLDPRMARQIEEEMVDEEHAYIKLVDDVYRLFSEGVTIINPFLLRQTIDFLAGDDVRKNVPCIRIEPLLWATLARQAAATKGRKELVDPGDFNDISAIGNFLPYCDVMTVDKAWHGRLKENPAVNEVKRYHAKIVSRSNLQELRDYLDGIEHTAPAHILTKALEVYGDIQEEDPFTALEES